MITAARGSFGGALSRSRRSRLWISRPPPPSSLLRHSSSKESSNKTSNSPNAIAKTKARPRDDASLARYPGWGTPGGLLRGADYVGTLTFVVTGTVAAAQSGLDVFGSVVVGTVTGVGGGTIRDAVFLNKRPFWTDEPEYLWMGLGAGLLTFFAWPSAVLEWQEKQQQQQGKQQQQPAHQQQAESRDDKSSAPSGADEAHISDVLDQCLDTLETVVEWHNQQLQQQATQQGKTAVTATNQAARKYDAVDACLDTLDAIGLSAFCIVGAQNGIRAGMPIIVSALCGMATATFGGMVRDILCGNEVRIVHSTTEIYAPPALAGATLYLWLHQLGKSPAVRIGAAFLACMGGRFVAIQHDVKLHTWDTAFEDNLGVTVRKKPTKHLPKRANSTGREQNNPSE